MTIILLCHCRTAPTRVVYCGDDPLYAAELAKEFDADPDCHTEMVTAELDCITHHND